MSYAGLRPDPEFNAWFYQGSDVLCVPSRSALNAKRGSAHKAPLPRKTPYGARVALQHCLILHMGKRKIILQGGMLDVNSIVGAVLP